jgi:WD40 repeat protein
MVHIFSLMDLVDLATRNSKRTVPPLHTFSVHHFPVTCLAHLPSGRIASAAEDGQLLIMELCSQQVLVDIQFPHGIQCLAHFNGRVFAGSTEGTIYAVNLTAYAMHQTEKEGATFVGKRRRQHGDGSAAGTRTIDELVFGPALSSSGNDEAGDLLNGGPSPYQTDWVGHDHPVTAIALLTEDQQPLLISGDVLGQVRIWDVQSRTCLHVLQPWSCGASASSSITTVDKLASAHPITSIHLIPQPVEAASSSMFRAAAASGKNQASISSLVTPLQKFGATAADSNGESITRVPFLKANRTRENLEYWETKPILRKRRQQHQFSQEQGSKAEIKSNTRDGLDEGKEAESQIVTAMKQQILALQKELQEKQSEIERWQKVSNKLMSKVEAKG